MVDQYFRALSALRKITPLLSKPLYDGLLAAIAERDNVIDARGAVQAIANGIAAMPEPSPERVTGKPHAAVRFLFLDEPERTLYVLERPSGSDDARPLSYFEEFTASSGMVLKSAPISAIVAAGAYLDLTFNPFDFQPSMGESKSNLLTT